MGAHEPTLAGATAPAILEAVATSAEELLTAPDWRLAMPEVLQRLGVAAVASRAHCFRNQRDPEGSLVTSQLFEWCAPGVRPFLDAPQLQSMDWVASGFGRWMEAMALGEAVHGNIADFRPEERVELEAEGIVSTLTVPIFAGNEWWGTIGLDDCTRERTWAEGEIAALRSAAGIIGASILRQRAQDRYQALVETIPLMTYRESAGTSREEVVIEYLSPQAEAVLGYPLDAWRDPTFWPSILHPADRGSVLDQDGESLALPQPFDMEYRVRAADGRTVWLNDRAMPVRDENGDVAYWQGFMLDITARKEAEVELAEAEERYRFLVERGPLATYLIQFPQLPVLRPLYLSPQFERIFGYPLSRWSEPDFWDSIVVPEDRERLHQEDLRAVAEGDFDIEYRVVAADGRIVWINDVAEVVVATDGTELWRGYVMDVTQRRQAVEEREAALEQERLAKEQIEEVSSLKDVLLQAVSHDLRTPLTAILGMSTTLAQPDLDLSDPERREFAQRITINTRRLDRLVSDLLDLDRLSRGELHANVLAVDLAAIATEAASQADIRGHHLEVRTETTVVQADPVKVERIIDNLLGNAAKHTPVGSHLWLQVRPVDGGGLMVVEDDGDGVPEADREAIFDIYRRGSRAPGSGVGLSLVRRFAEIHGGRAWVEDRPGGGASFRVWLPGSASARP